MKNTGGNKNVTAADISMIIRMKHRSMMDSGISRVRPSNRDHQCKYGKEWPCSAWQSKSFAITREIERRNCRTSIQECRSLRQAPSFLFTTVMFRPRAVAYLAYGGMAFSRRVYSASLIVFCVISAHFRRLRHTAVSRYANLVHNCAQPSRPGLGSGLLP